MEKSMKDYQELYGKSVSKYKARLTRLEDDTLIIRKGRDCIHLSKRDISRLREELDKIPIYTASQIGLMLDQK